MSDSTSSGGGGFNFSALSGIGSGISALGGAASSLLGSQGSEQAAQAFDKAAALATQDAQIQGQSTAVQEVQTQRKIQGTLGSQRAEVAAANLGESASTLAIMRDSAQQGAMTTALVGIQGQILQNGYTQQAEAYTAQAQAARTAASAGGAAGLLGGLGGLASGIAGVAKLFNFSDRRLKRNIRRIGIAPNGLPVYSFEYVWAPGRSVIGFMADEVRQRHPGAVAVGPGGFLMVNYAKAVL